VERLHRKKYRNRAEAAADVQDYIERFYNNWRKHSALDYKCPTQYERDCPVAA
jgi:putative transposase